jgi:outer membrane protein OmpA-like peptidoglycan-associated protein
MSLLALTNQKLSETVLEQLARATATPLAATRHYAQLALPALVEELARPVSIGDLNARWDMCRQLFLSQLLTEPDELLRTDMGWPERRYYLAQNVVGEARFATLTKGTGLPEQAPALLGYLTLLVLATIGQHASQADLAPAALGTWLAEQRVPASPTPAPAAKAAPAAQPAAVTPAVAMPSVVAPAAVAAPLTAAKPEPTLTKAVTKPDAALAPATATAPAAAPVVAVASVAEAPAGKSKATMLSVVGALAVVGLAGGYFLLGTPANATQQEVAAPASAVASVAAATPVAAAPAPTPAAPAAVAAAAPKPAATKPAAPKPVPAKGGTAPVHTAAGTVLIDTIGNAAQASHIGGSFNAALGRYPKGEGQPLDIKLINRSTLSVGINSSESLLYKRLVNSGLSRPSSVALDRLVFDPSQAKLGAEGAQQLGNVAHLLKTFPKARILVLGHATTKEAEAMRLSLLRANAAIDELVKQGISTDRLQAQGVLATGVPAGANAAEKLAMQQGVSLSVSRL